MERGKGASKGKEKVDAIATDGGGSSSGKKASVAEKTSVVTIDGRRIELQGPIEETWSHGSRWGNGWKCGYCPASNRGGGATRLREHLCGLQGQVAPCSKAPRIVKDALLNQVALVRQKRRNTNEGRLWLEKALMEHHYEMAIAGLDEEGQYKMAVQESLKEFAMGGNSSPFGRASMSGTSSGSGLKFGKTSGSGSKAASCSGSQSKLESFYKHNSKSSFDIDLARSMGPSQPRVDVMLAGGAKEKLGKALSKWFHANDIPGRKADCPYFRSFIKLAQQLGDVPIPSGREIDGKYLHMNYEEMMTTMAQFRDDDRMSAADWWGSYGGQCRELQQLAIRIVSQCMSSSGCERNWSTFALIHTKLRNKLGYDKLHELVFVHYNLKLRIQQFEADFKTFQEMDADPYSMMMNVTLFDESNPIMDWLCNSMSESTPTVDECDDLDSPTPSAWLLEELGVGAEELAAMKKNIKKKKKRCLDEEEEFEDYDSDRSHGSPMYDESGDNEKDGGDDDIGGDGIGASGGRASGGDVNESIPIRPRSTRNKRKPVKCLY